MTQAAWIVLLGMAEVFVLLLGEIDLSIGYHRRCRRGVHLVAARAAGPAPWPLAVLVGLAFPRAVSARSRA